MPFDGVTYLRCVDCGEFVVDSEAGAHERGCTETTLVCRLCDESVPLTELRDHLLAHNPNAAGMDTDQVRARYTT